MQGYTLEVASYTRGLGSLICMPKGYLPCHNAEEVIEHIGYDAERDLANTGDSVFCSHGSGFVVPWREAASHMHLESGWKPEKPGIKSAEAETSVRAAAQLPPVFDDELRAIFERTYGPIRRRDMQPQNAVRAAESSGKGEWKVPEKVFEPEYLLIDGYNILFAWDDLNKVAEKDIDTARQILMDKICNYQSFSRSTCILVFDAYRVPRDVEDVIRYHNISVVFTKQAETADTYIERATFEIGKKHRVRVATSDGAEQMIVLGHGARRVTASEFKVEVDEANKRMREVIADWNEKESARHAHKPFKNLTDQARSNLRAYTENNKTQRKEDGK